jgi:glycosyltransferase involved in cell wall biosynthesis
VRRVRYAKPERETLAYEGLMQQVVRSPRGVLAFRSLIRALEAGARAEAQSVAGTDRVVHHAHWWVPAGLALPSKAASLITLHGTDGRILRQSVAARWLGRRVLRRARVVSAVSPELAAVAEAVSGRHDIKSHVQPMPVARIERPVSEGGGGLFVVARLTPQKRTDLAIRAAAELSRRGSPLPLTVIGEGLERARLEQLAASLPILVTFTGELPAEEVARRLGSADVLLFPAYNEGLGLAAVEALMAGVPVVACSDGGGVVSALRRHGGGIISAPNPAALADGGLTAMLPERRGDARRAGEQWRSELAPERVAEVYESWYREALGA